MKAASRSSEKAAGGSTGRSTPAKSAERTVVEPAKGSHRRHDVAAVLCVALAIIIGIALAKAEAGLLGATLGTLLETLFGRGAWGVPAVLLVTALGLFRGRGLAIQHLVLGLGLLYWAVLGFLAGTVSGDYFDIAAVASGGGYVGAVLAWSMESLLGAGRLVGMGALGLIGAILCVDVPVRAWMNAPRAAVRKVRLRPTSAVVEVAPEVAPSAPEPEARRVNALRKTFERDLAPSVVEEDPTPDPRDIPPIAEDELPAVLKPRAASKIGKDPKPEVEPAAHLDTSPDPVLGYTLPPSTLLSEAILQPKRAHTEMQKNIETLEGTLEQFGIEAQVVEVATGPTVTRYEIVLGPGVRVNRITSLADNIAMDLAASQVRVEAPIPGKAAIGVEVPNAAPGMVTLRELVEDPQFKNHSSRLCVALGKDVAGVNRYADLTKMPHLLIGGATNSGKSIGLATLITSLIMRNSPKECRLVMIDPKRVELTLFDHIPHLMCPVIKDVKEAAGVLRAVWREMDRRYDLFSESGVRNIDGYNAKSNLAAKLPYIVVIVDELADLMIQCGAEVETVIVRLAQLARAVGIHLVIATQRPSVDVITGLIKANIPSRIAFSVASAIDSRTILDGKGAEALIGKGDMLFSPIDANKPLRVQGCFVSEKEIEAICRHWREQSKPDYVLNPIDDVVDNPKKEGGDFGDQTDPLWEEAVTWVVERGEASTSMMQRKFSIGFQRASRLLDMMEQRGIVGPRDGPRPRDVLVGFAELDTLFGRAPQYDVGATITDEEMGLAPSEDRDD